MVKTKRKIDFTNGPIFWRLLWFMLPIVATNLLQVLYDTADKIVVGRFSGDHNALAAIGSTTFITNLMINLMIGVGAGASVVVAQAYGARDNKKVERSVHNAFILGLGMAAVMSIIAYSTAAPLLRLLDTKDELFDSALLYARIIYTSILATAIYNIGASVLRAIGDSSTSLRIGMVSGLLNVILNLFFVIVCKMSVEGVAIATVMSKYYSAGAVLWILYRKRRGESYAFNPKKLIPEKAIILRMLRLGVPTGIQSACFSIANLAATKALNSFPSEAFIAARSIGTDIDHITSTIAGAFLPATMTATAQNVGARRPDRIKLVFWYSMIQATVIVGVISNVLRVFAEPIAKLFIEPNDPDLEVKVAAVATWCGVLLTLQMLAGILNAGTGVVRGLGYSFIPLMLNLVGTVGSRLTWIWLVFNRLPERGMAEFKTLAYMYPISWGATALFISILCIVAFVRLERTVNERAAAKEAKAAKLAAEAEKNSAKEADDKTAVGA